ncbi:LAMI_0E12552g1_1 [Lachancea mirantina]|uniref:LAMI_0E12552g1_1 n=1 Tax=Lachancea mirantina TaxID=1230905 RepID=A0A1G4JQ76_9SACH|nr:LAMI_0E12552g1_1 [Lachancea mirantina]
MVNAVAEIVEKDQGADVTHSVGTGTASSRVMKKSNSSKKRRKDRCLFDKCGCNALKFIGDCQFCHGHFCSKHRLMENHACQGLKSCKEQMHQRNADKLAAEQTIVPKIQI